MSNLARKSSVLAQFMAEGGHVSTERRWISDRSRGDYIYTATLFDCIGSGLTITDAIDSVRRSVTRQRSNIAIDKLLKDL